MARVSINRRRRSNKGGLIVLIVILLVIVGVVFFVYHNINNSLDSKLNKIMYTFAYDNDYYFVRVNNEARKIFILKTKNNITFPQSNDSFIKDNVEANTDLLLTAFNIKSDMDYYIKLNDDMINEIISLLKYQKTGINGFFDALKYRSTSVTDPLIAYKLTKIITKYDRETKFNSTASVYSFMKKFVNLSITSYDKLTLNTDFEKPLIVNVNGESYEKNFVDINVFNKIKAILE